MAEVRQYDRHRRFKQHRVKGEARSPELPPRPVIAASGPPIAADPAGRKEERRDCKIEGSEDTIMVPEDVSTPKYLLASRPRRPPRSNELERPSSPAALDRSHSSETDSIDGHREPSASHVTRLPPPFSAPRRASPGPPGAGDLIGEASPATPPRSSSLAGVTDMPVAGSPAPRVVSEAERQIDASYTRVSSRLLRSAVRIVESSIRSPSRGSPWPNSGNLGAGTSNQEREVRPVSTPRETDTRLQVYNDFVPASVQPQTPLNLPESRHQSRLRGPHTAPVTRASLRASYHAGRSHPRPSRASSPAGVNTPGFQGLYGGVENSDDLTLYHEGSRLHESEEGEEGDGANASGG